MTSNYAGRKTITKLIAKTDNPSKLREIEYLEAVAESVPANSYLASLFSRDFVDWVKGSIRGDLSCDAYGYIIHGQQAEHDLRVKLENRVEELETVVAQKDADWEHEHELYLEAFNKCTQNAAKLIYQTEKIQDRNCKVNSLRQAVSSLEVERNTIIQEAAELTQEVINLKAEMCDVLRELRQKENQLTALRLEYNELKDIAQANEDYSGIMGGGGNS
jgi:hypothetical protein